MAIPGTLRNFAAIGSAKMTRKTLYH